MYRTFYGLTRKPFELSPDPYFYYPTPRHNEALALLTYGVLERKGFVVVSGEVGTGKTLLLRCLLDVLSRHKIAFAFVYNPVLSVGEFLALLLGDLAIPCKSRSKIDMLAALNSFLMARSRRGEITALIVDEAQLLNWELFEEIRLLTNLETSQFKLLQIVLVGQPELDRKLDSHGLRQLKQRVAMRCRLGGLELEDVRGYMQRRLELAGASAHSNSIFPEETVSMIHRFSRGLPRLINTICENALIAGYGRKAKQISPEIIEEIAADFSLSSLSSSSEASAAMPQEEGLDEVLGLLASLIEEGDLRACKTSRTSNREARTGAP